MEVTVAVEGLILFSTIRLISFKSVADSFNNAFKIFTALPAPSLKMPKNKLIEKALRIYLDQLNKAEYVKSYRLAAEDADVLSIAEEGMVDYFNQLEG